MWRFFSPLLVLIAVVGFSLSAAQAAAATSGGDEKGLLVGAGVADATGPAADVNLMGYAMFGQTAGGVHLRLRSRAFVISEADGGGKSFAFVSLDAGMASTLMKTKVIEKLASDEYGLGDVYTVENVLISGTHTHSAPAGFLQYVLYQVSSLGFVEQAFDAFVTGVVESIVEAHGNLVPASIFMNSGELKESNINRSPTAYVENPQEERDRYDADTDLLMTLLKFVRSDDGSDIGMLNWFAVHGTSMNNTNKLLSGDNKGYAGYLFEREMNGNTSEVWPGQGDFVGAFAQTNLGDVSPNTAGPRCLDTGLPCDTVTSTCGNRSQQCVAFGPGTNGDMFESTQIIGANQFDFAKALYDAAAAPIAGAVDYRHMFVDMPKLNVTLDDGSTPQLCSAAMGYSFAAGTTDGPGMFDFTQSTTSGNPFWDAISSFISEPTDAEIACQAPKPILLNTGDCEEPYEWDPAIVPIQILSVGQLYILGVPAEFTTMPGRRLRESVADALVEEGAIATPDDAVIVIAGLANTYASYVTTFEEYQVQRYEGASTIFGPHTHQGYVQEMTKLARAMAKGEAVDAGPTPPDLSDVQMELLPGVVLDDTALGSFFGELTVQPEASYTVGETVTATFRSACPRNDLRTEGTFLEVQQLVDGTYTTSKWIGTSPTCAGHSNDCTKAGLNWLKDDKKGDGFSCVTGHKVFCADTKWETVAVDGDWETKFIWSRDSKLSDRSYAEVQWDIPSGTPSGTYRILHHGNYLDGWDRDVYPFTGTSNSFEVA